MFISANNGFGALIQYWSNLRDQLTFLGKWSAMMRKHQVLRVSLSIFFFYPTIQFKIETPKKYRESTNFDAARFNRRWANGTRTVDVILSNGRNVFAIFHSIHATQILWAFRCIVNTVWRCEQALAVPHTPHFIIESCRTVQYSTAQHSTEQNRDELNSFECHRVYSNILIANECCCCCCCYLLLLLFFLVTRLPWLSTNNTNEWAQIRWLYAEASRFYVQHHKTQ